LPSLCSGSPSKILQIFPHQDYLPSVGDPGGGENDKKGEAGRFYAQNKWLRHFNVLLQNLHIKASFMCRFS
jgi:hypothetical protein